MASIESIYELQLIDCNCNDCKFMKRDLNKKKVHDDWRAKLDYDEWFKKREAELSLAMIMRETTTINKIMKQKFKPMKPNMSFGFCTKFDFKEVSFIPNTCQLETQNCFEHRKSLTK